MSTATTSKTAIRHLADISDLCIAVRVLLTTGSETLEPEAAAAAAIALTNEIDRICANALDGLGGSA